jgi:hypothetical protein
LTAEQILSWADEQFKSTGEWPKAQSGPVVPAPEENWANLDQLLQRGLRGLPGGSSLAQLLEENRNVRNVNRPPILTEEQVLTWADEHYARTGKWPDQKSGALKNAPEESWTAINTALQNGGRGFPGGSSLMKLFEAKRGKPKYHDSPALTEEQILAWADAHKEQTGKWPRVQSGPVINAPQEKWGSLNQLLQNGGRGLLGGSSVAKLLEKHRQVRNVKRPPKLTEDQILAWADAYYKCEGEWPAVDSGLIQDTNHENWRGVDGALQHGLRGLAGGSSLPDLLARKRGARNKAALPPLTIDQILSWAEGHFKGTGHWPTVHSQPIQDGVEKWRNVDNALRMGLRGLPGGSSLAQLLADERGIRNKAALPPLTKDEILAWADAHHRRTGQWPKATFGAVTDAPHETWGNINQALRKGLRGLPAGSSLVQLLASRTATKKGGQVPARIQATGDGG